MKSTQTIGHEKQKHLLLSALKNGQLAHAYALCGEENIGKTMFATEFAALAGADPVLDLVVIDTDEAIIVSQVRDVQARLSLTPAGKIKVAVIKADLLGLEAANSLLKLLEEPPAHSLIFLVISNFYNLLPTVASRVQKIMFGKSTDEQVMAALEQAGVPEETREDIAAWAEGRIGLALRLAADEKLREFYASCAEYYQQFENERLVARLQTAEKISALEEPEIRFFLKFCMRQWAGSPIRATLGKKLETAFADLDANVNRKLAMDNLFI